MNNLEKYLPIGSVVRLKNAKKNVMITGYLVKYDDKIYDYTCCLFPGGIVSLNDVLVFNHDEIEEIYYLGYRNESYKKLNECIIKSKIGDINEWQ